MEDPENRKKGDEGEMEERDDMDDLEGDVHFIALRYLDLFLNRGHKIDKSQGLFAELEKLHEEMSQLGEVIFTKWLQFKETLI
jgi:hypothetical protein